MFANIAINGIYLNNPQRLISIVMFLIVGFSPKKPLLQQNMGKTTRVVVCGLKGVGKTAILEQLIYGNITKTTVWINSVFAYFVTFYASVLLMFQTDRWTECLQSFLSAHSPPQPFLFNFLPAL